MKYTLENEETTYERRAASVTISKKVTKLKHIYGTKKKYVSLSKPVIYGIKMLSESFYEFDVLQALDLLQCSGQYKIQTGIKKFFQ